MRLEAGLSGHLRQSRDMSSEMARSLALLLLRGRESGWRITWPQAECLVVERGGEPIGRLWADRSGPSWQLLHLALLPRHRGRGLAQATLRAWLQHADAAGATVGCCATLRNPFVLQLHALGFTAQQMRRGQVWLQRAPAVPMAGVDDPTLQLAA
jgi:GNAT superfamily N-acetyltransferase